MTTAARLHALDQLRALAMLLGVMFHAALAYSPLMKGFWPLADRQTWSGIDVWIWLSHLIRMPLFFLIAGYFTAWLIENRGSGGLLRQRVRRVLIPLLVALPLVHIAMDSSTQWGARHVEHPSPMLGMIKAWLAMPNPPAAPISTGHLWFLYYLLLFSLLYWIARVLAVGDLVAHLTSRVKSLRRPAWVLLALPILPTIGFALTFAPHPAPESLLPQLWALLIYGPFFVLGVALNGHLNWLDALKPALLPLCALALLCYLGFLYQLSHSTWSMVPNTSWLTAALQALIAVCGTLACLLAGIRWLAAPKPGLRYLAASSYWTYLLHLPLLFGIQYWLMDLNWHFAWKLLFAVASTMLLCLLSYELLVRRTPLKRLVG